MSNKLRQLEKNKAAKRMQHDTGMRLVEIIIFGAKPTPTSECAVERAQMLKCFGKLGAEFKEKNAARFWAFLLAQHQSVMGRGQPYNADRDGPSEAMQLVEDVEALRAVERDIWSEKEKVQ